jgi:signal transduction histidine kinase
LTNIQKHAQASHVTLTVHFGEHLATLCLRDDGRGFEYSRPEPSPAQKKGFGLQGIRERIELVSGRMSLLSQPQQGTELSITVPKKPTELVTDEWLNVQLTDMEER